MHNSSSFFIYPSSHIAPIHLVEKTTENLYCYRLCVDRSFHFGQGISYSSDASDDDNFDNDDEDDDENNVAVKCRLSLQAF